MCGVDAHAAAAPALDAGTVEVWWSTIDLDPPALGAARADLDGATRDRIDALLRPDDRRRSTIAHALLRRRAAELLGVAPAEVVVRRRCAACGATDHGRPELARVAGAPPLPAVSLAHAGAIAAVALRSGGAVGIDVEPAGNGPDWARIRGHVFAGDEWAATGIAADPEAARLAAWTRKEAAAKATGHGVALGLERIRIDALATAGGWHDATLPDGLGSLRVRDVALATGYAAAVAVAVGGGTAPVVVVRRGQF